MIPSSGERRRRERLKSVCGLRLYRPNDLTIVETSTENVSSEGFYCKSDTAFAPGDELVCELMLLSAEESDRAHLTLSYRVRVVRVEVRGLEPGFGLACRFERRLGWGEESAGPHTMFTAMFG